MVVQVEEEIDIYTDEGTVTIGLPSWPFELVELPFDVAFVPFGIEWIV